MAALANRTAGESGAAAVAIDRDWQMARAAPGSVFARETIDALDWIPVDVPGTVAGALRAADQPAADIDADAWWFRTSFESRPPAPDEEVRLRFGGLATLAEVYLNGARILESASMWKQHRVDVGSWLRERNELVLRFAPVAAQLAISRRPRARWRTRLVADNNLRWIRTTLHGRIPGFSAGPVAIGPWRPIVLERRRTFTVDDVVARAGVRGTVGVVHVRASIRTIGGAPAPRLTAELEGPTGRIAAVMRSNDDGGSTVQADLEVPGVELWWPHTHGGQPRYQVTIRSEDGSEPFALDAGRVGFRSIAAGPTADHDVDRDGLFVHINGVPIFSRGALWNPLDVVSFQASREELRSALETVVAAGMNMLRLPGYGIYESDVFHDLCDELGIMVWQDLMFASMDYPFDDPEFGAVAANEVAEVAGRLAARPSTTVLSGNSEVHQQVAMLGLDLALLDLPFYRAIAPRIALDAGFDAVYVAGSPSGGELPLRPDRGVSNYYAVGGYRAPLSDARTSGVRFASECLAFANVPDEDVLAALVPEPPGDAFVHHPRWKAGVPRDSGSGWDFDDLRDDYLAKLFGVEPRSLRRGGHDRYLELSRAVSGEVMAAVFGEWRRAESPSGGGMILWLRDLIPGAGWGVVDHRGQPKTAYHHLRRALAPVAVWLVDEGIGGLVAHVANDRPEPLEASLRVALYTDLELPVGTASTPVSIAAHDTAHWDLEAVLGRFVDITWAYRFGPPAQDVVVVTLERAGATGQEPLSQAFHFPAGRPLLQEPEGRLGLRIRAEETTDGSVRVTIASQRLVYGLRLHVPGFTTDDNAFSVEPGGSRVVTLRPNDARQRFSGGGITALNLLGRAAIRIAATPAG